MSLDSADDIQGAEDLLGNYAAKVEAIRAAYEPTVSVLSAITEFAQATSPYAKFPSATRAIEDFARLGDAIKAAERLFDDYCRPTCGHRDYRENDGQEGETIDFVGYDCLEDTCGCPCHRDEEWDLELEKWVAA